MISLIPLLFCSIIFTVNTSNTNVKNIKTYKTIRTYKVMKIKSIKGQLSDKVKKTLLTKYWKYSEECKHEIEISYKIFEFMESILVKIELIYKGKLRKFSTIYKFSSRGDWRHDPVLIETIAYNIHMNTQILVNSIC